MVHDHRLCFVKVADIVLGGIFRPAVIQYFQHFMLKRDRIYALSTI